MWKLTFERFGHDGSRAVMVPIESPEAIGAIDLVEVGLDEALPPRDRPKYVGRNANGMDRRAYVIAEEEIVAEARIRALFRNATWFRATVRGTYWENGRQYGIDRIVYLARE